MRAPDPAVTPHEPCPAPAVGLDLVDIAAFSRKLRIARRLEARLFRPSELSSAAEMSSARRAAFLAGRFAVKEALLKALGVGISGDVAVTDIEVVSGASGAPAVVLHQSAKFAADAAGVGALSVSISHDGGMAGAVVVLASRITG
jgi:holo-[acyl-carrier protein] synthase